jgi:hypothetical protein
VAPGAGQLQQPIQQLGRQLLLLQLVDCQELLPLLLLLMQQLRYSAGLLLLLLLLCLLLFLLQFHAWLLLTYLCVLLLLLQLGSVLAQFTWLLLLLLQLHACLLLIWLCVLLLLLLLLLLQLLQLLAWLLLAWLLLVWLLLLLLVLLMPWLMQPSLLLLLLQLPNRLLQQLQSGLLPLFISNVTLTEHKIVQLLLMLFFELVSYHCRTLAEVLHYCSSCCGILLVHCDAQHGWDLRWVQEAKHLGGRGKACWYSTHSSSSSSSNASVFQHCLCVSCNN